MPETNVFSAIADPGRRAILQRLAQRPHAVHELAAQLPVSRSAVSQHLKQLRECGLVTESRAGKFVFYQLQASGLRELADWLAALGADRAGGAPPPAAAAGDPAEALAEEQLLDAELARWETIWPGPNPLGSALAAWIRACSQIMQKFSLQLGVQYDINLTDISILGILHRIGAPHESTATNLSRISWTSLPGMTRRLDHLERRGLIKRIRNAQDGRSRVVRLSEKGSALLQQYVQRQFAGEYGAVFDMPAAELRLLVKGVRRLLLRLQRIGQPGAA